MRLGESSSSIAMTTGKTCWNRRFLESEGTSRFYQKDQFAIQLISETIVSRYKNKAEDFGKMTETTVYTFNANLDGDLEWKKDVENAYKLCAGSRNLKFVRTAEFREILNNSIVKKAPSE